MANRLLLGSVAPISPREPLLVRGLVPGSSRGVITTVKDKDLDGKFVEMDVSVAFPLSVTRRRYKGSRPWVYLVSRERARGAIAR